ncbi:hypothetical protein HC891_07875 [Candidatus Gracilibacteria bacterium]|nr:hypothetical protein [Candidatus Gracilibacteria bacterium]
MRSTSTSPGSTAPRSVISGSSRRSATRVALPQRSKWPCSTRPTRCGFASTTLIAPSPPVGARRCGTGSVAWRAAAQPFVWAGRWGRATSIYYWLPPPKASRPRSAKTTPASPSVPSLPPRCACSPKPT